MVIQILSEFFSLFLIFIQKIIWFFANLDTSLIFLADSYGILVYPLLFLIIFCETGLVVTPFLPGDSLLFAIGALSAEGSLNILFIFILLSFAAILGDNLNYVLGKYFGEAIVNKWKIKKEYTERTHNFYEKYGGKTIIFARFVPIIRTFAPFIAGIGKMSYNKFFLYNLIGGILWVALLLFTGFYFGNMPVVKNNFSFVIFAIIFISILPAIIEFLRQKSKRN